jgi:hypothetical protein
MVGFLRREFHSNTTWSDPARVDPVALVALSMVAAIICAFLFNQPHRIVQAWQALSPNPAEGIPRLRAVMIESALFIGVAVGVQEWLIQHLGRGRVPSAVTIILLTSVMRDLLSE